MKTTLLVLSLAFLSACALNTKNVKVLTSKSEIHIQRIEVEDQDTLLCDPEGCRKLK